MEEKREEEEVLGLFIKERTVVVVIGGEGEFNGVKDARGLEGSDGRGIMNGKKGRQGVVMGERETVNDEEVRPKKSEDIWRDRGQKPGWQTCGRNTRG